MRMDKFPVTEMQTRLTKIKKLMQRDDIPSLLLLYKVDYFYFTGSMQTGLLYISTKGESIFFVKKYLKRAKEESPFPLILPLSSYKDLPKLIKDYVGFIPKRIGIEWDVVSVADYMRMQKLFPEVELVDATPIIREIRKNKSQYEINKMKKAGLLGKKIYEEGRNFLKEGMSEIEFAGILEAIAKKNGHEGLLRMRGLNGEAYTWCVLSGESGGIISSIDAPTGGFGLSTAFPLGASRKKIKAHEPILVDFGAVIEGYQVDQTRIYSIGDLPDKFVDAYNAARKIEKSVIDAAKPGTPSENIYYLSLQMAKDLGYSDYFLGPKGAKVTFVGHGIGIELNELPFIAKGHKYPIEEDMTFATEIKLIFPNEAAIGIENTVWIKKDGYEKLTPISEEILLV